MAYRQADAWATPMKLLDCIHPSHRPTHSSLSIQKSVPLDAYLLKDIPWVPMATTPSLLLPAARHCKHVNIVVVGLIPCVGRIEYIDISTARGSTQPGNAGIAGSGKVYGWRVCVDQGHYIPHVPFEACCDASV